MASAGLSWAVGKIIVGGLLLAGIINAGNVVANEKISPQLLNALLIITGAPVDSDDDGVNDLDDEFPNDPSKTRDTDGDGVGDNEDEFPANPLEFLDSDGDGLGNNADPDDDNDEVADTADAFPLDPEESIDSDNDGIGNNADPDDDNDGDADTADAFPLDPEESLDSDNDGIGNNADLDDDNDSISDSLDDFPLDPAASIDTDNDGMPDDWNESATDGQIRDSILIRDDDDDNDGVPDASDAFPYDPAASIDTDSDGMPDDWNEGATALQIANSSLSIDEDDDNDGIPDAEDVNPLVPDYVSGFFADFSGPFNGAVVDAPFTYRVPAEASADAGFANINNELYPFTFSTGGRISLQAWVPSGGSADIHFRFEKAPFPDTEQSFSTESITISGSEPAIYTVAIPRQGMDVFASLIFYIETRDVAVVVDGALVEDSPTPTLAIMSGAFGGFEADGPFLYNPSTADATAGVANENPLLYPLSFPEGGEITFVAAPFFEPAATGGSTSSEGPGVIDEPGAVSVYFRFEQAPSPDNDPSFNTEPVEFFGPPADYVVSIPPQPADQTFSSFLMFIEGVGQGVVAWDINVSMMSGPMDSDGDGILDAQDAFPNDPAASVDTDNDGQPDDWNAGTTDTQIAESTLILDNDDDNDGVEDALDPDPTDPNVRGMAPSGKVEMDTLVTLDSDTNNVDNGYVPNDNAGSPAPDAGFTQKIGDAQVVFGYLAHPGVGPAGQARDSGDVEDYYVLNATAGTELYLEIGDPENADIDLWLYTFEGAYVTDSSSPYPGDSVTLPETGTYIVNAHLHSGHGSYALVINEPVAVKQDTDVTSPTSSKTSSVASTPMNVSAMGTDVGTVYVLLINAETGVVESVASTNAVSNYEYDFALPAPGHYFLLAGTDNDNDQSICDADDICGFYGSAGNELNPINISGAQSGLDVVLQPGLGAGSLGFPAPMIAN